MSENLILQVEVPLAAALARRETRHGKTEIIVADGLSDWTDAELRALAHCARSRQTVNEATLAAYRAGPVARAVRSAAAYESRLESWMAQPMPDVESATDDPPHNWYVRPDLGCERDVIQPAILAATESTARARRALLVNEREAREAACTREDNARRTAIFEAFLADPSDPSGRLAGVRWDVRGVDPDLVARARAAYSEREARIAAANDAREKERLDGIAAAQAASESWIATHGSPTLKRLVAEEMGYHSTYIRERIAAEWPEWVDLDDTCGQIKTASNVTAESFAAFDAIVAEHPDSDITLAWLSVSGVHTRKCIDNECECPGSRLVAHRRAYEITSGLELVRDI